MGKVHIVGYLRDLVRALQGCEYPTVDMGPLLGGPPGGPYLERAAFDAAMTSFNDMNVLIRDNGPAIEICSYDGVVFETIPTV